jgi:hypothetical protein
MRARADYQARTATGDMVLLESNSLPAGRWADQNMGWGGLVEGQLLHYRLPAGHEMIFRDRFSVARIAAILRPLLDQVDDCENIGRESAGMPLSSRVAIQ